ncbi:MAG: lactonase family protein [Saprospiraceae bacterium]|nr:lactonase family protein [Saprospiraceae bacterium]
MKQLLVGTYTDKESKGIYLMDFNPSNGELSNSRLLVETPNPSFLTYDKKRQYVYAVNEGQSGQVSSFKWNDDRSGLVAVNQQSSEGSSPCHIELNDRENLLAVANYSSGNLSIYKMGAMGMIQPAPTVFQHQGSGPLLPSQEGARAHCVKFDPNGKFLYAVDLGIDQIITYPVLDDATVGSSVSTFSLDPGDGPRHMIFHPSKDLAFVVNELGSSVTSMKIDHTTGRLQRVEKASTIPSDFQGKTYCADVHITKNGKFLYASNRGHHSIAIFKVSDAGALERIGIELVRGEWPNFRFHLLNILFKPL